MRDDEDLRPRFGARGLFALALLFFSPFMAPADMLRSPATVGSVGPASFRVARKGARGDGVVVVLYADATGAVQVRSSGDDGRTFGLPATLAQEIGEVSGLALCVDARGRGYAAWRLAPAPGAAGEIRLHASFTVRGPNVESVGFATDLAAIAGIDVGEPILDCNDDGEAVVVWEVLRPDLNGNGLPDDGHDIDLASIERPVDPAQPLKKKVQKLTPDGSPDNLHPDVALLAGGVADVVLQTGNGTTNRKVVFHRCSPPEWEAKLGVRDCRQRLDGIPGGGDQTEPAIADIDLDPALMVIPGDLSFELSEVVIGYLDDVDGYRRTHLAVSEDGGATWRHDDPSNPPITPDEGACPAAQARPRVAVQIGDFGRDLDGDGTTDVERHVTAAFECTDVAAGGNVAFANLSRDGGLTWQFTPALPLDDTGATGLAGLELSADPVALDAVQFGLLLPDGRREVVTGVDGDGAWLRAVALEDGDPPAPGNGASLAAACGLGFLLEDDALSGVARLNATTGETRLDTECPAGACDATSPALDAAAGAGGRRAIAAWVSDDLTGNPRRIETARSADGGRTWIRNATPVAQGAVRAPAVAIARPDRTPGLRVGDASVLYIKEGCDPGGACVASATSRDGGRTWTPAGRVSQSPIGPDTTAIAACAGALAGRPVFLAAWPCNWHYDGPQPEAQLCFARYDEAAGGWLPEQRVDTPPAAEGHVLGTPEIACDRNGGVCLVWEDARDPAAAQVRVNCSADGGASWGQDARLDVGGKEGRAPRLAGDGEGHYIASWLAVDPLSPFGEAELQVGHTCSAEAAGWASSVLVASLSDASEHDVALEPFGHALVAWRDDIALHRIASADWGNSWSSDDELFLCMPADARQGCACVGPVDSVLADNGGAAVFVSVDDDCDGDADDPTALVTNDFGAERIWLGTYGLAPDGGNGHEGGVTGLGDPTPPVLAQDSCCLNKDPCCSYDRDTLAGWPGSGGAGAPDDIAANGVRMPSGVPGEVGGLLLTVPSGLRWLLESFDDGAGASYDVYRAAVTGTGGPPGPFDCLAGQLADPSFDDPDRPAPGTAFFYVVTAVGPGGEGSPGRAREIVSCEPPPPSCW